jgi:murein DD-endopeptidase MepM/ murein hydrolase activator NlpD
MKIRDGSDHHTFGMVRIKNGAPSPHQGWDLEADVGTPVFAVHSGKVKWIKLEDRGGDYGNQILLEFTTSGRDEDKPVYMYAFYAHLDQIQVSPGDEVQEGRQIGLTGRTGNAAGDDITPHLHFEIRDSGAESVGTGLRHRVDPTWYLGFPSMNERPGGINREGLFGSEDVGDFSLPNESSPVV